MTTLKFGCSIRPKLLSKRQPDEMLNKLSKIVFNKLIISDSCFGILGIIRHKIKFSYSNLLNKLYFPPVLVQSYLLAVEIEE